MQLLVATSNPGKRREFAMMLSDLFEEEVDFIDMASWPEPLPDVVEDRDTFLGNAVKKAVETSQNAGVCAMSEDSGLAVDALDGAPGVYSARFAGEPRDDEANNRLLIERLAALPDAPRTARYVATICLALVPGDPLGDLLIARLEARAPRVEGIPQQPGTPGLVEDRIVAWWRGEMEGEIIDEARGEGGFGYDPHFLVPEWGKTNAEVPAEQKNSVSHRATALRAMAKSLAKS